ncbi:iron-containing alcohol dehydrogenase [Oceanirhabdus sp. W0125-5]|uniref:iron-containing alcohol dehydrogenase n=1 Tax=Oceanirhabdus sp. W0125-5 TaxID=2999116 RepID=UPI0022F34675|nr:iron-containing alcohol dehydrogenase [Oceanirhabdus sp. W0125-5]WBW98562.1 iron-containing alcohol dehydrogenase [Oceanirhabdus sp. W0125-5]
MNRFTLPRDIYFGENSLAVLKELKGKKAMVVTGGSSMQKFGFLEKVEAYLKEAGMEVAFIEGVEPDPSVETVFKGAEKMREFGPDWIVSIGGGSPIDAAKAMWIFYEHPEKTFDDVKDPFTVPELRTKAKFVAIPSTSGTATEVTAFSVITDYNKKIKYPLADYNLTPDIAIVDPEVASTMPPKLVAHTGMDAFTHALEAYVACNKSSFSDPLAMEALEMVKESILKSYEGDLKAKGEMHIAQCLAGMSFSNALLGITHSMAHKTGAVFNIPHGCANAIYLPSVVQFNAKECGDRYAKVASRLGLKGETQEELISSLVQFIRDLNKKLNIPASLKEFGVTEELFNNNLDYISNNAVLDACTGSNPRQISVDEMKKIFECTYYGTNVEF